MVPCVLFSRGDVRTTSSDPDSHPATLRQIFHEHNIDPQHVDAESFIYSSISCGFSTDMGEMVVSPAGHVTMARELSKVRVAGRLDGWTGNRVGQD